MTLKTECPARVARLQKKLLAQGLDGALFVYPIDIYYFTATRQNSTLWIPAQGEPLLLVRKSLSRAQQEACIADIRPFPRSKDFAPLFAGVTRIGVTFDVMSIQLFNYYSKLLPEVELADISALNRELRSVKSKWELERLRHAGRQLCQVFAEVPEFLRPGLREVDVSAEFEARLRRRGGEGYVRMRAYNQELFMGLVVSGASGDSTGFFDGAVTGQGMSQAAPHGASNAVITADQPILIDYTGVFDGYIIDVTRMFVCGALDAKLLNAFEVACRIQAAVVERLKPGVICSELFDLALHMAEEAGLAKYFMGQPGENAKFVGHGVGLELDELPVLAQGFNVPLSASQTIAIEPKFVVPGLGPIGIENTFVVSKHGGEQLSLMSDELVRL